MRVLLFDWNEAGHHEVYLRRFAEALRPRAEAVVAAPASAAEVLGDSAGARFHSLGEARPATSGARERMRVDRRELDLLADAVTATGADHALHLFGDHLLPALSTRPRMPAPLSLLLLRPRAHYGDAFGSQLGARERAAGRAHELLITRFRRRADAHAVFTLDPAAAARWERGRGAPAHWMPEPWVEAGDPVEAAARSGFVLFGYMSSRKGVDRLARAVALLPAGSRVVLAGNGDPLFEPELLRHCETMRRAGAQVERIGELDERGAQRVLSSAQVAVLPYRRHVGMSRVLIEAAMAGTPVVTDRFGLLGHLAEKWDLGVAVDTDQPHAFCEALVRATDMNGSDRLRKKAIEVAGRGAMEDALSQAF